MADEPESTAPGGRRRGALVVSVVVVVLVAAAAVALVVARRDAPVSPQASETWFAPYVSTTTTPLLHFEDPLVAPARTVVLGFVVAAADGSCAPSWGAHYSLEEAAGAPLDLDGRIGVLRSQGRQAVVSFGGAASTELALRCADPEQLAAAYAQVLDRYEVTSVDFDLEGVTLEDLAATTRRASAVRGLQERARSAGSDLDVALTLPVGREGLSHPGAAQLDAMLAAGVDVSNLNALTMDYTGSMAPGMTMFEVSTAALEATFRQVSEAYVRADQGLDPAAVWARLGATPMVGQNDVAGEVFTLDDARRLQDWATSHGLGRLSMWSVNRDRSCPPADPQPVSATCSGVEQRPSEFAQILSGAQPAG